MDPKLLLAVMEAATIGLSRPMAGWVCVVVAEPKFTQNLFGPISEIAGKTIRVIKRNTEGDCLCLFDGKNGQNLVDVDHRDIASIQAA